MITCFIHSFGVNHYKSILDYYFDTGRDFFQNCDKVFIAYGAEPPHRQPNNSHLIKLKTPDEMETMKIIKEYASKNIDDKICYIHTKGVTKDNECITECRKFPYFCNSIFFIKTSIWKSIISDRSLFRDAYDEVPFNLFKDNGKYSLAFIRNSNCIHPSYNTIEDYIPLAKRCGDILNSWI